MFAGLIIYSKPIWTLYNYFSLTHIQVELFHEKLHELVYSVSVYFGYRLEKVGLVQLKNAVHIWVWLLAHELREIIDLIFIRTDVHRPDRVLKLR